MSANGLDGFFETALEICENTEHPDSDSILVDLNYFLGEISLDNNDRDNAHKYAFREYEVQMRISDNLGTVDERLALAITSRGIAYIDSGDYEAGIADLRKQREMRETLGSWAPQSRESYLSHAYLKLGRLDECESLLEECIGIREKLFGKNDDSLR
jgi:tetratricopeptide (TPR) repeat protein